MIHTKIRRDAGDMLSAALVEASRGQGRVIRRTGKAWASATFAGMRHSIEMYFAGTDAVTAGKALAIRLNEREFDLKGHIVADINAVQEAEQDGTFTLEIEALTVEDV
ncbi:hypothetical protein [Sphingorhabdus sp. Alg239-R122]|uniref:hypothetical protein n=1 Tax=Sphingorhabdus sp. Alg239-R122 TaxID=2305989 RepID=UPI0013D9DE4A|nr:hypothetical protein [Sphingorhabdus sp. Alg239-R122]